MAAPDLNLITGRRIDVLGRVQGVALGSVANGTQTTIFTTNDMDFRGHTVFIAYVTVELLKSTTTPTGVVYTVIPGTFDPNLAIDLGANGGSDWGQATIGLGNLVSPAVLYNAIESTGNINMVVYGSGTLFTVVNRSAVSSSQIGQLSAWGWAYG